MKKLSPTVLDMCPNLFGIPKVEPPHINLGLSHNRPYMCFFGCSRPKNVARQIQSHGRRQHSGGPGPDT